FGRRAITGYNVDSFGHAGSLPQILLGCGLQHYVFFRPQPGHEKDLPGTLFWWESDDGSRVLTSRPPLHYPSHPGDLIERIDKAAEQIPPDVGHVMCFYGVGNHGGGPTRANIASILQAQQRPDGPEVVFGRTDDFFALVRESGAELPVLHDELQHHARGCYTAVSRLKWYNRACEQALLTAEKFATWAHQACGLPYPRQPLTYAWENVLFNQFHDIMAGTSLREACDDAYESYQESERLADLALETALAALVDRIDTQCEGQPLVLFNPHPWEQEAPVEVVVPVTSSWHGDWRGDFRPAVVQLTDQEGATVPTQVTALEHSGGQYLIHFCFRAHLPALGYRTYAVQFPEDAPTWQAPTCEPAHTIENEHLRLVFDPDTGWLTSLYDKDQDLELLRDAGGVLWVIDDPSDTWSHDVVSFDKTIGRFEAGGEVIQVEHGPIRQTVRVEASWGCSTATLEYVLYADTRQVELNLTVDWHEQLKMLKLGFPLQLENPQSTASIPYGSIQRVDDGGEEPCQGWVDVSGTHNGKLCGLALLNDSKYGYDVVGGELRMTILRSPVFAFHRPREIEPGVTYHYTDQGEQVVRLALVPHPGDYREGDVVRLAAALNAPPIAAEVDAHPGEWPGTASFLSCSADNVVLTALKLTEEGDDLILRGYETAGQETTAEIRLGMDGQTWSTTWRAHEIKTLRWNADEGTVADVNMLEEADE
ncbi:MAG: alpha-mannosidase, partial [Anaerolineae bacterium]